MPARPKPGLQSGDVAHPIELLDLSTRPYNALRRGGVRSIEVLLQMSEAEISRIRGVGGICYGEIRQALQRWQQSAPVQETAPPPFEPELDEEQEGQPLCVAWSLPATLRTDQTDITTLGLKPHAERELIAEGISTVDQLVALSVSELRGVRWFGFSTVDDIRRKLSNYALLHTAPPAPPPHHRPEHPARSEGLQRISPGKFSSQELVDGWIRRLRSTQQQAIIDEQGTLADEPEAPCDADGIEDLGATAEASTDQDSAAELQERYLEPPEPTRRLVNAALGEKTLPRTQGREAGGQPVGSGSPVATPERPLPLLVAWSLPPSLAHDDERIAVLNVGYACDLRLAASQVTTVRQLCALGVDDLARIAGLDEAGLQRIRLKLIDRALLNGSDGQERTGAAAPNVSKMVRERPTDETPRQRVDRPAREDTAPAAEQRTPQRKRTHLGRWTEAFRAKRASKNPQPDQRDEGLP